MIFSAIGFVWLSWKISYPPSFIGDETYYVSAAKSILENLEDTNYVHPPLGKYFIALGIWLFGDSSFGWRIMGAIIGSLSFALIFALGNKLYGFFVGCIASILLILDPMHHVLARAAMLDIFLAFFILLGFLLLAYKRYTWSAFAFGLACSVKLAGAFAIIGSIAYLIHLRDYRQIRWFITIPLIPFLILYLPIIYSTGFQLWTSKFIFSLGWHVTLSQTHPDMSHPLGWLFNVKPFLLYENIQARVNPFLYPAIYPFLTIFILDSARTREKARMIPILWFAFTYGLFFLLPRATQFIFYILPSVAAIYLIISYGLLTIVEDVSARFKIG